ncbi:hypothetical protein ACTQ9L_03110 [Deinococcus wulumuqiensis]
MSHAYRAAYLLLEQPFPRRGNGASRRAFYRLFVYNYELSRRLGVDKFPLTRIRADTRNRGKKVVLALQWYLLVTEELVDSIYDTADTRTPREAFDHLCVQETLDEAHQLLCRILPPSPAYLTANLVELTHEFESFFQHLRPDSPLDLQSSNEEVRQWVKHYQRQHTVQVNTLDPADYGSKIRVMDQELASLLAEYRTSLDHWPDESLPLLLLSVVMLFLPLTELLSYAELVEVEFGATDTSECRSLLAFYAVVNPAWLARQQNTDEWATVSRCQGKLVRSFGLYDAHRIFPSTLQYCDELVARWPLDRWLSLPMPGMQELRTIQEVVQAYRNNAIFSELSQADPDHPLGCWQMYRQAGFMALLTTGLPRGDTMLRAHYLRQGLCEYLSLALELLSADTWDEVLESPSLIRKTSELLSRFAGQPEFQEAWSVLTDPGGLLERLGRHWHWRRELGENRCLLDLQECSPEHLAFVHEWQTLLLQIHVDETLLLRLCRFFEEATRERHSGRSGLLHSVGVGVSPAEPRIPVPKTARSDGRVERWRHAAQIMLHMRERQEQHEKTITDWQLRQVTPDILDTLLKND